MSDNTDKYINEGKDIVNDLFETHVFAGTKKEVINAWLAGIFAATLEQYAKFIGNEGVAELLYSTADQYATKPDVKQKVLLKSYERKKAS